MKTDNPSSPAGPGHVPTSPVHVLHLVPTLRTGGAERLVTGLASNSKNPRFTYSVLTMFPLEGTFNEQCLRDAGVPLSGLHKRPGPDPGVVVDLYRALRRLRPHVAHTHLYTLRYALIPLLLSRVPVIVHTIHTVAHQEDFSFLLFLYRLAFRRGWVQPVAISEAVARTARELFGDGLEVPVVPNGISLNSFTSAQGAVPVKQRGLTILNVARLDPAKNHDFLLVLASRLRGAGLSFHLQIAGDGPLKPKIEHNVKALGLESCVSLLGTVRDVATLYANADVFVLPSTREGLPLVLLEAMAAGLPVVASSVGGIPEVIKHGLNGLALPPNDLQIWSSHLLRLAQDPTLRRSMGRAARETVRQRFDIQLTIAAYERLYLRALSTRFKRYGSDFTEALRSAAHKTPAA